jgi:hypothetical protein
MKRLNPITELPFSKGDVRDDGFIFKSYDYRHLKKNGFYIETWLNPISFKKCTTEDTNKKRSRDSKYAKQNRPKRNALAAKRKAIKLNRTPPWLNQKHLEQIEELYTIAKMFKMYTGQEYHVDHIVPLQGKNVSGLHAPWNLQVLPAKENMSKGIKHVV